MSAIVIIILIWRFSFVALGKFNIFNYYSMLYNDTKGTHSAAITSWSLLCFLVSNAWLTLSTIQSNRAP